MRAYMIGYKLPTDMIGGQVAKYLILNKLVTLHFSGIHLYIDVTFLLFYRIIASRHDKFPVGKYVAGQFGWRTHTICKPGAPQKSGFLPLTLLPDLGPHPVSLGLGVLGMPG